MRRVVVVLLAVGSLVSAGSCATKRSMDGLLVRPNSIAEGIKMLGDLQRENAALKKELEACKGEGS